MSFKIFYFKFLFKSFKAHIKDSNTPGFEAYALEDYFNLDHSFKITQVSFRLKNSLQLLLQQQRHNIHYRTYQ